MFLFYIQTSSIFNSGYADRIHELMVISKELSASRDKTLVQNSANRKYISEANYIEFSNVKVSLFYKGHIILPYL